jgi:alginate O-acetyltransferase complex protein AlgI
LNAYTPNDVTAVLYPSIGLLAALVAGFAITRLPSVRVARCAAWLLVIVGIVVFERLTFGQPPGFRMFMMINMTLFAMKAVVAVESRAARKTRLNLVGWFGFAGLWFGMRPTLFARVPRAARDGAKELLWLGAKRFVFGVGLVIVARLVWVASAGAIADTSRRVLATVILLPGLSLMLHFGLLNMLAGLWRYAGADCKSLFRAPLLSKSLVEFWGQRWNLAFSEMTSLAVFRPLRGKIGNRAATTAAFLFSGLLHELAISVPVNAGFGLPMLYFALHGVAMSMEQRWHRAAKPIDAIAWRGRLWTMAWILIPLPILFHWPFLNGCVWPLIGIELP